MAEATRSLLFVPGDRPERFDKAQASGADAIVIDLEDAVAIERKEQAREAASAWLRTSGRAVVRVNASETAWFEGDVALATLPGLQAVMLPKAEDPRDVARLAAAGVRVLPLIETARGFANVQAIACAPGVQRLVFGSIDFQLDLGIRGDGEELLMFRSAIVLASRLAGLPAPIDGVTTALSDPQALLADATRARRLGFGGKLCIHPSQVTTVHSVFSPDVDEVDWARRVIAASDAAGGAAVAVDGKMADKPVLLRAHSVIAELDALSTSGHPTHRTTHGN